MVAPIEAGHEQESVDPFFFDDALKFAPAEQEIFLRVANFLPAFALRKIIKHIDSNIMDCHTHGVGGCDNSW